MPVRAGFAVKPLGLKHEPALVIEPEQYRIQRRRQGFAVFVKSDGLPLAVEVFLFQATGSKED